MDSRLGGQAQKHQKYEQSVTNLENEELKYFKLCKDKIGWTELQEVHRPSWNLAVRVGRIKFKIQCIFFFVSFWEFELYQKYSLPVHSSNKERVLKSTYYTYFYCRAKTKVK